METLHTYDPLIKERAATLRSELKQWEKTFAAANEGRKASREEIKTQLDIAAKYKEYNRLKDTLLGIAAPVKEPDHASRKRKCHEQERIDDSQQLATPPKRKKIRQKFSTPRRGDKKAPRAGQIEILEDEALAEEMATPIPIRLYVGPTPQKDGRALGLFDLLSPAKTENNLTPRKEAKGHGAISSPLKTRGVLEPIAANSRMTVPSTPGHSHVSSARALGVTPQKRKLGDADEEDVSESTFLHRHSRTPQSVGRRFLLSTFVPGPTSRTQEDLSLEDKHKPNTPSTSRKIDLAGPSTPAFLRRDAHVQESSLTSPSSSRWLARPRRLNFFGLGKSSGARPLSSMIADMRKAEDEKLDEEMDLFRNADDGASAFAATEVAAAEAVQAQAGHEPQQPHILDSIQEVDEEPGEGEGRLGPDGVYEEQAERNAMTADGPHILPNGKVWKKKGLRRQTRRVLLRPQASGKAAPADVQSKPLLYGDADEEGISNAAGIDVVPDTQLTSGSAQDSNVESDADDESKDEDFKDPCDAAGKGRAPARKRRKLTKAPPSPRKDDGGEVEGAVKRAVRKISATATAHANFCRLKIRSKNSGPKGGKAGGRFGGRGSRR